MIDVVDKKRQERLDPTLKKLIETNERSNKGFIRCMCCNHVIAHLDDRSEVMGSHLHKMTNPHGFTHYFACYSEAPGVVISGQSIAAVSWFPGFSWKLAQCEGCDDHMGWVFERSNESFCGLIVSQIRTA